MMKKYYTRKAAIKKRNAQKFVEDLPIPDIKKIDYLAKTLVGQIHRDELEKQYAPVANILKMAGAGIFLTASFAIPNLPVAMKPFLTDASAQDVWKRFNLPYLKRSLKRLEEQRLIEVRDENNIQIVRITDRGRRKILKYALDEIEIQKPKRWDNRWRLISYDLPESLAGIRNIFRTYLKKWGFYQLHESVFLHAYSCERKVDFLREYLGVGEYVRIFTVSHIENDSIFQDYFGI
jgi:DNA-binding PadR family transcriptional regulator